MHNFVINFLKQKNIYYLKYIFELKIKTQNIYNKIPILISKVFAAVVYFRAKYRNEIRKLIITPKRTEN